MVFALFLLGKIYRTDSTWGSEGDTGRGWGSVSPGGAADSAARDTRSPRSTRTGGWYPYSGTVPVPFIVSMN